MEGATATTEGSVMKVEKPTATTDMDVVRAEAPTVTMEGGVAKGESASVTMDVDIVKMEKPTAAADGSVLKVEEATHTMKGSVVKVEEATGTTDESGLKAEAPTATMEGNVLKGESATATTDVDVTNGEKPTATANGNGVEAKTATPTTGEDIAMTEAVTPTPDGNDGKKATRKERILEQVEYYFGDINLPRDRFLQSEIKLDDGWVPMSVILKCNRLARITTDGAVVAEALEGSKLIQVSDDKTKIRRDPSIPLPENSLEHFQTLKHRSVYVSGFKRDATLDEVQEFMKQFGEIKNVVMRREKAALRVFKGSVFVTFAAPEDAIAFVANDVKEYNGSPITKMMQDDYWREKQNLGKEKRSADRAAKASKTMCEKKEKCGAGGVAHFVKGLILLVENLPPADCTVAKLRDFFEQRGNVGFIAYEDGDTKAQIRFQGEESNATKIWEAMVKEVPDGKLKFGENVIAGRTIEGEEEEKFWDEYNKSKLMKQMQRSGKRFRGSFGSGRGRGRGGSRGFESRARKRGVGTDADKGDATVKKSKRIVFDD